MGFDQVLPLRVKVDLGIMAMKGCSTFFNALKNEPHHQMQFSVISRTFFERDFTVETAYSTLY